MPRKFEYAKLKRQVFEHYGLYCWWCKEPSYPVLTIDHKWNQAPEHKRHTGVKSGSGLYHWLRQNGYPKGFQTLCANCQQAKRANKGRLPRTRWKPHLKR